MNLQEKPEGLSQKDQTIVMVSVAIILLIISVIYLLVSANPQVWPEKFRPNAQPFFEEINKMNR